MFLYSKTCVCVGDMCYLPVASAIIVFAEELIDPESIAITRLRKEQFTWDLHEQVEWLLGSTRTKILFKYTVESSCRALISMCLWQFSIHLYCKLIYGKLCDTINGRNHTSLLLHQLLTCIIFD